MTDTTDPKSIQPIRNVFAAKRVPLPLLFKILDDRAFHRNDWASVEDSVAGPPLHEFDFYFDFVLAQIDRLKSLGVK